MNRTIDCSNRLVRTADCSAFAEIRTFGFRTLTVFDSIKSDLNSCQKENQNFYLVNLKKIKKNSLQKAKKLPKNFKNSKYFLKWERVSQK